MILCRNSEFSLQVRTQIALDRSSVGNKLYKVKVNVVIDTFTQALKK